MAAVWVQLFTNWSFSRWQQCLRMLCAIPSGKLAHLPYMHLAWDWLAPSQMEPCLFLKNAKGAATLGGWPINFVVF